MKITTIIGARPQFIKAAVVSRAIKQSDLSVEETIIHTGQHFDQNMSDVFFKELDIPEPDYNLSIGGGSHGQNTGRMIESIEEKLIETGPDWVLVYGDTDSTLAGALAASKLHIPVAHVEAGLRSFNRKMPEEINRVLTDHISDVLFTPTQTSVKNLESEGISGDKVKQVGDVMYDAALFYSDKAEAASHVLKELNLVDRDYILATLHRQENVDSHTRLTAIIQGFADSGQLIVLPLHPRTCNKLKEFGIQLSDNILPVDPVGYLDMVMLEKNAKLIATDSGGVQKEAYFHKVPCLTLRDETEWVELVEHGFNQLVGGDKKAIYMATTAIENKINWDNTALYGDGHTAEKIIQHLLSLHEALHG